MRPADLDRVCELELEMFTSPWSRRSFQTEIRDRGRHSRVWILEIEGDVAGYLIAWFVADEVHLANIAVAPQWQRKGYGVLMVNRLLDDARAKRAVRVTLEVRVTNAAAIALYERLGFVTCGIRPGYYHEGDRREDARIMELVLTDSDL